jgi:5-methylcytosine-specific restriction endonuclease McrA
MHVVKMVVGPEFLALLERVRAAFSHLNPGASLETLLGECMNRALTAHEKRARGQAERPRAPQKAPTSGSRHIPAHVRREVWERDGGRCTFLAKDGRRCDATHRIQFHHEVPDARGGPATVSNVRLACAHHNDLFARRAMSKDVTSTSLQSTPASAL